jgi:hypothetical protein
VKIDVVVWALTPFSLVSDYEVSEELAASVITSEKPAASIFTSLKTDAECICAVLVATSETVRCNTKRIGLLATPSSGTPAV